MIFEAARQRVIKLMRNLLSEDKKQNISDLLKESLKWQPRSDAINGGSYKEEIATRLMYKNGDMQADMNKEIERRFKQTYVEMQQEQVNLPIVQYEIRTKAKVFSESCNIYLVDKEGNKVEGNDADNFDKLKKQSGLHSTLKSMDGILRLCHRAMFKPWYDTRAQHMRTNAWSPNLVDIVPDALREWDVDSALAVAFTRSGADGYLSKSLRYEVWGYRDIDAKNATGNNTVHFITDENGNDIKINEEDINPVKDPATNKEIYPFVWWVDSNENDSQIYTLGDSDCLTINRRVNSVLCDLLQAIHLQAWPIAVHRCAPGGDILGNKVVGPGKVIDLSDGSELTFESGSLPISEVYGFCKDLADASAMLKGLPATALRTDIGVPESGYHLQIRNKPLSEDRTNMIDIYRPKLIESVRRLILMHNLYNTSKLISNELEIIWEPGEMEVPTNPEETGRVYAAEIAADVSTPFNWHAARYKKDIEQAKVAVEENAVLNKELKTSGRSEIPDNGFGNVIENTINNLRLKEPAQEDETIAIDEKEKKKLKEDEEEEVE